MKRFEYNLEEYADPALYDYEHKDFEPYGPFYIRTWSQRKMRLRQALRRLQQHEDAVLAFALVVGIPFTNNLAERDLRPAKVKQKVSGCFRTALGAEVYACLQAIIATCRKQDRNIFATLRDIFSCQPVSILAGCSYRLRALNAHN